MVGGTAKQRERRRASHRGVRSRCGSGGSRPSGPRKRRRFRWPRKRRLILSESGTRHDFDGVLRFAEVDVERQDVDPVVAGVFEDQSPRIHAGFVGQDPGQEVRRIVCLEPCGLVGRDGEGGRVRLAEAERGEGHHLLPDPFRSLCADPSPHGPGDEVSMDLVDVFVVVQVATDHVGGGEVVSGHHRDHSHQLLVVDDNPMALFEDRLQQRMGVRRRFDPVAAVEERRDHVRFHRTRPEQGDVDDEIRPLGRLVFLEELALARRFDLEASDRVRRSDELERGRVARRDLVEFDLLAARPGDLVQAVAHRREHPHAEHVELQQPQQLDVVLVRLDHPVALERSLERHPIREVMAGEHDAGGMKGEMPGESIQPLDDPEQHLELPGVQVQPIQLGKLLHGLPHVMGPDVRERLRRQVDLALGEPQRLAHLADGAPGPVRVDHRHARAAVLPVPG